MRIGVAGCGGVQVELADQVLDGRRKTGRGRRVLIFAAHVKREGPAAAIPGKSVIRVNPLLVRAAIIVDDCLPEMMAIVQWQAIDAGRDGIERLQPCRCFASVASRRRFQSRLRIPFPTRNKVLPLLPNFASPANAMRSLASSTRCAHSIRVQGRCPRNADPDVAQRREPLDGRINPAIEFHVRRSRGRSIASRGSRRCDSA